MNKLILLGLILLLPTTAYAQLYGDLVFDVQDDGEVDISGSTNYGAFQGLTSSLTSKEGELWFLNITSPVFEEYIYRIKLPKYSVVNYIKSNTPVRIEESSGAIIITGTGSNKSIDVDVQYTISKTKKTVWFIRIGAIIAIIILALVIDSFILKKANKINKKKFNRDLFTDRQLKILDYLQQHGLVTQVELEKGLLIPKASLSRNIKTLVQKDAIFCETKGMSNIIGIK